MAAQFAAAGARFTHCERGFAEGCGDPLCRIHCHATGHARDRIAVAPPRECGPVERRRRQALAERHGRGLDGAHALDAADLSGALTRNIGDGKSTVFDTRNTSLRGNADWSLGRWDTVYLGAEYRSGDSVSTVSRNDPVRTLGFVNTASPNIIRDDAFNDTTRDAYRLKARTLIATLGYNRAFGERHALDVSWRRAQSSVRNAADPASGSDLRYTVNQYALAYLVRF